MFMSIAGAIVIGLLTGTFYYCSEAAPKEPKEEESSPTETNDRPPPKRPPRKRRNIARRFDNGECSSFTSSRSTTSESSIGIDHGHATKVVTALIEKHPNETSPLNDTNLNLLRSVLSSFYDDLALEESALRGSEQRSFVTSPNDNTEKALARKTLNDVTSQNDETERYHLNVPPISSSNLRREDRSIDRSMFQINPTIDAFTSTKIICPTRESYDDSYNGKIVYEKSFYFPSNEKNESNDSQNDNAMVVVIRLRKYLRKRNYIKNDKSSRSKDYANKSSLHTTNLTTMDYKISRSKEYLMRKKRSEKLLHLFQCHK